MKNEPLEGVVKKGRVVPTDDLVLPEGAKTILTIVDSETGEFWLSASQESAERVWGNAEDAVYAELFKK